MVRLLNNLPESWQALMPAGEIPQGRPSDFTGVALYSRATKEHIPLDASNKRKYIHFREDLFASGTPKADLLAALRALCQRDGVPLDSKDEQAIWKSSKWITVDYPPFADYYWRLLHGNTRTGEQWMPNAGQCPRCSGTIQTAEHLAYGCITARAAWALSRSIYTTITGQTMVFRNWAELLLTGIASKLKLRKTTGRLWRILFGTTLYILWTQRCEWSFGELEGLTVPGTISRLRKEIYKRYLMDRQLARDAYKVSQVKLVKETWNSEDLELRPLWFDTGAQPNA